VLKSKLRKRKNIGLTNLKNNVKNILDNEISEETYKSIINGSYNREKPLKIKEKSNRQRKLKKYKD